MEESHVSICYKFCEVFLQLGLTRSKTAFPSPEMSHDDGRFTRLVVYMSGENPLV